MSNKTTVEWLGNIIFQNVTITAKKLSNQTFSDYYIRYTIQQFRYVGTYSIVSGMVSVKGNYLKFWEF